jgi:hypothetical protein
LCQWDDLAETVLVDIEGKLDNLWEDELQVLNLIKLLHLFFEFLLIYKLNFDINSRKYIYNISYIASLNYLIAATIMNHIGSSFLILLMAP